MTTQLQQRSIYDWAQGEHQSAASGIRVESTLSCFRLNGQLGSSHAGESSLSLRLFALGLRANNRRLLEPCCLGGSQLSLVHTYVVSSWVSYCTCLVGTLSCYKLAATRIVFFWPAFFTRLLTPRSRKFGYGPLLGCRSGLVFGPFEKTFF